MNKLIFYKRKKQIKIFFVPFKKKKELIKEITLSLNNPDLIDDLEMIFFETVAQACGFDINNDSAHQEFCKEFWDVDFFDTEEINQIAKLYNLEIVSNGFGHRSMAFGILKELNGGNK